MSALLRPIQDTKTRPCEACKHNTGKQKGKQLRAAEYEILGGWVLELPYVIQWVCKPCVTDIWGTDFTIVATRLVGNAVPAHLRPVVA